MFSHDHRELSYQKNPEVSCAELDEGAVLLDLNTKYYYNLNETGLRIWQSLDRVSYISEIVEKIVEEYEVDRDRAARSVKRILEELQKEGLVLIKKKKP
jgi:hypothetical protein